MARTGYGGRNFEYLGEDPLLAGTMAASEIQGIQGNDVIAMAKHYVLNDQEANRMTVQVQVDNRTLHEIYMTPFESAVKDGHVDSVMCSYNLIGATHACDDTTRTRSSRPSPRPTRTRRWCSRTATPS